MLDQPSKEKLAVLLFQLSEQLKSPPVIIDFYDWREDVEYTLKEIKELSPFAFERLDDLVSEAIRIAALHVSNMDRDASPKELEQSSMDYHEQVAFVLSEINSVKSH